MITIANTYYTPYSSSAKHACELNASISPLNELQSFVRCHKINERPELPCHNFIELKSEPPVYDVYKGYCNGITYDDENIQEELDEEEEFVDVENIDTTNSINYKVTLESLKLLHYY